MKKRKPNYNLLHGMIAIQCRWDRHKYWLEQQIFYLSSILCVISKDFITIYDGYTTRDPVILKFCGGGGNGLAAATSSGPELLIEFVTSPFGTLESSPVQSRTLNGFHLEVSFTQALHQQKLISFSIFVLDLGWVCRHKKLFIRKKQR